ncbi:hypothetical protein OG689_36325 [Kitasatospora sp. NBC_00240]|uniref:hypothetical protein n=1 Tax=Kitasatospora sp. NBC_00240 TaxID=2903567 RepID=UPI002255358B|nr:hypothetical protein [Kitasatospora sp. NBC_00240]MCX5214663.1 hypothetical protein [Kitasatospora sp. NBC_00240]
MGLRDDLNKAQAAARSSESEINQQAEAAFRTAARVWNDFLAYCRDFATLAPQNGIPSQLGKELVGRGRDKSRTGPGYVDVFILHPGGWIINRGPGVTPMFYITTGGELYVEGGGRTKDGYFPSRKIKTYAFAPCPAFPAAPPNVSGHVTDSTVSGWMPWRFEFRSSAPMGCSDVVKADVERLGGSVVLDTPWDKSFAKDHILNALVPTRR